MPNGLRVVHCQQSQTAMVCVTVLYDTGARDEKRSLTGIAHLFEHLMFGGSVNVPEFDSTLEAAGGVSNAYTSNDFTVFYDMLPAQNAETAFYLESDRMLSLSFSDKALQVQRDVVTEEFKQVCLNRPYGRVMHTLRRMLYPSHPYGWPVIGLTPEHIARVSQQDVRDWFFARYSPGNAILAVCGNITMERTRQLSEKWFGPIEPRPVVPRSLTDDPWPAQLRTEVITDNVPQTAIFMGYRMDPYGERGYFAADAITDLLAAGKSSRFFRNLVSGTGLFTQADASITGSEHSGMLLITAFLASEGAETEAEAIAAIQAQLDALTDPAAITEYELQRAKNRYEANFTYENMALTSLGQNMAMAEYHGEDINAPGRVYQSLTVAEIAATARRLFTDHAPAIVICRPA